MPKPSVFKAVQKAASNVKHSYRNLSGHPEDKRTGVKTKDMFKQMYAHHGAKGVAKLLGHCTGLFTPAALLYVPIFFAVMTAQHHNKAKRAYQADELRTKYGMTEAGACWIVDVLVYGDKEQYPFPDEDQPGLVRFLDDLYEETGKTPLANLP
jgi:hypothetical protein